jgi:hypothetical protein
MKQAADACDINEGIHPISHRVPFKKIRRCNEKDSKYEGNQNRLQSLFHLLEFNVIYAFSIRLFFICRPANAALIAVPCIQTDRQLT